VQNLGLIVLAEAHTLRRTAMPAQSTIHQQLTKLKIAEVPSIKQIDAVQTEMLQLLNQSTVDPISYAGLEYCNSEHCGRVNCSEACWFGRLRRQSWAEAEGVRLLERDRRHLQEAEVCLPKWDRRYGDLLELKSAVGNNFVGRVFRGLADRRIVAVGTLMIRPFGYNNYGTWRCEIQIITAGITRSELETRFREKRRVGPFAAKVTPINNIDRAVKRVMSCNEPADPADRHYLGQRAEFYSWLFNMKVGSRLIQYNIE
jgi:hypothetical protein